MRVDKVAGKMFRSLFFAVVVWASAGAGAHAEQRVALVIANSAYKNVARLQNPANDAKAVVAMFKAAGFDSVDLRSDLNVADMRRTLREFSAKARGADMAVIYYAGHGVEFDGINYLVPVDATLEMDADVYDEAFALDRVLVSIESAKQLRLIILDACRDNPFAKTMKRTLASRSIGRGLARVEPSSPNTMIAFAAKAGSIAYDGDTRNSPFAVALVEHLAKPGLDLRKAFGFVRDDVLKATNYRQEPFVYGSLGGNDVALVPAVQVPQPEPDFSRRDYELAERAGTRSAWDSFIGKYQSGFYVDLAKAHRDKLATDAARIEPAGRAEAAPAKATDDARIVSQPQPAAERKEERLASLSAAPERPVPQAIPDLPRLLQSELKRVGCNTSDVDGNWNLASQRALEQFNRRAGTTLDVTVASLDALEAVKSRQSRVCPLSCEHGFKADGDRCVKLTCRPGFEVGEDNSCEKTEARKPVARREPGFRRDDLRRLEVPRQFYGEREKGEAAPPKRQASSGQILCGQAGCRPVTPGCRLRTGLDPHYGTAYQREICN